jgi:Rap1a immunity proteins
MTRLALAAAIFLMGSAALAVEPTHPEYSANSMLPRCKKLLAMANGGILRTADDIFSAGRCMGMIEGTSYLTPTICAPAGATTSQRLQVIISYIEARPARMNEDLRSLALEAMEQAWPCKQ